MEVAGTDEAESTRSAQQQRSTFRFAAPPAPLSRFIGRDSELTDLDGLMNSVRLLTLTGAGGSGKTRLAAELVGRIGSRFSGVSWVDLATMHDSAVLENHVATAFGLIVREDQSAISAIGQTLRDERTLLILDNCEHVIEASAALADALLRELPNISILATSREALGIAGESAWLVPPLVPGEARDLFFERARSVAQSFARNRDNEAIVSRICRRLDGIPLAIELAAARVKLLSLDQIEARLDDALRLLSGGSRNALPRHRTLRGAIEWSYALLDGNEQTLLRRLSIFPGHFSLDAAEAIASDELLPMGEVLDSLAGLVDKSLVMLETTESFARYRVLETVRQFGAEHLAAAGEIATLTRRHAEHYLRVAEGLERRIFGGTTDVRWVHEVSADVPNFRSAVEWAAASPERYEIGLRYCWALHWYWWARGPFEEARRLMKVLDNPGNISPLVLARAYAAFAHFSNWQGRPHDTKRLAIEGLPLAEESGDKELLAYALVMIAAACAQTGDPEGALAAVAKAYPLAKEHSRETVIAGIALHFRGIVMMLRGNFDEAFAAHTEELEISRTLGHLSGITHSLTAQANVLYVEGRRREALPIYRESLAVAEQAQDAWGIAKGIEGIGTCLVEQMPEQVARIFAASEAFRERSAFPLWPDEAARYLPAEERLRQLLGERIATIWSEGRALPVEEGIRHALSMSPGAAVSVLAAEKEVEGDLSVRTLGRFEVVSKGKPIGAVEWGSSRPRELLVLLLLNPRGLSKEQVGLLLWPDATSTQVRNNFHVTLHRLRKTLGASEWVTSVNDRYSLNSSLAIDFDAARFDKGIRAAVSSLRRGDAGAENDLQALLSLYHGPFLDGESFGDWATDHRERLGREFTGATVALALWQLELGRNDSALENARLVLAQDQLHEEAWRITMTALSRSGQRSEALRAYQTMEKLLASALESEPEMATVALRDRIQAGGKI